MKIVKGFFVALSLLAFAVMFVEAGHAEDCSRTKRIITRTAVGLAGGALTGAIVDGRKGAAALGGIAGGVGLATAIPAPAGCKFQKNGNGYDPNKGIVLSDAQKKKVAWAKKHHEPIPNFSLSNAPAVTVTAAIDDVEPVPGTRAETKLRMPAPALAKPTKIAWIRSINGADPQILNAIMRRPLYNNGYGSIDPTRNPDPKDDDIYFIDVTVRQSTQANVNPFTNVSGPRGSIFSNSQAGAATFFVSVSVYRGGEWQPELSFDRRPFTPTLRGFNDEISTRIHDVNLQVGGNGQAVAVDPATQAAVQAIYQAMQLHK